MKEQQINYPPGEYRMSLNIGMRSNQEELIQIPEEFDCEMEEWLALTDEKREQLVRARLKEWAMEYVDYSIINVEDDE